MLDAPGPRARSSGVDGDRLVTYARLPRSPLPDRRRPTSRRGARRVARTEGGRGSPGRARRTARRLVHETRDGDGPRACTRDRARWTAGRSTSARCPTACASCPAPPRRWQRPRCPPGWVLLAPDGRLPSDPALPARSLRHLPDGLTVPLDEADPMNATDTARDRAHRAGRAVAASPRSSSLGRATATGARARPGPGPVSGGLVRPEPGPAVPLALRRGADAPRSRPPSRPPRPTPTRAARSQAATFAYDAGGSNPIGYGAGATCGVNGLACFTRDAPDGFTMWLREQGHVFDWGTLKWCQAYSTAAQRLLRRRDDRARRVRPRRGPRPPRQLRRRLATTTTPSSRRSRGPSRRPAGTGIRLRPLRRGDPPDASTTSPSSVAEVLDLPRPRRPS